MELIEKELTQKVIGAAMEIKRQLQNQNSSGNSYALSP
jgi:hypothetical protein